MVFDTRRQRVVLHGGTNRRLAAFYGDMWEWDGAAWTLVADAITPPRGEHALAFDEMRNQLVMFAGYDSTGALGDTWLGTRGSWMKAAQGVGPPSRDHHAMVYHAARGVTLLFGGTQRENRYTGDTWTWDGTRWTELNQPNAPSARGGTPAMTYDSHRRKVIMYGGWGAHGPIRDLWEWDGTSTRIQADAQACAAPPDR